GSRSGCQRPDLKVVKPTTEDLLSWRNVSSRRESADQEEGSNTNRAAIMNGKADGKRRNDFGKKRLANSVSGKETRAGSGPDGTAGTKNRESSFQTASQRCRGRQMNDESAYNGRKKKNSWPEIERLYYRVVDVLYGPRRDRALLRLCGQLERLLAKEDP